MEHINPAQSAQLEIARLEMAIRALDRFMEHMTPVVDAVTTQTVLYMDGVNVDDALKKELVILEAIVTQIKSVLES